MADPTRTERDALDVIVKALEVHYIECTGPGEVTCRCREGSWMSPYSHREHVAAAVLAALQLHFIDERVALLAERDRYRSALEAIRDAHYDVMSSRFRPGCLICGECQTRWPCPTVAAVDAALNPASALPVDVPSDTT